MAINTNCKEDIKSDSIMNECFKKQGEHEETMLTLGVRFFTFERDWVYISAIYNFKNLGGFRTTSMNPGKYQYRMIFDNNEITLLQLFNYDSFNVERSG